MKRLAELLKVKTLVTFAVVLVFSVLALKGHILPDNVMIIVSMVVSFKLWVGLFSPLKEEQVIFPS